MYADARLAADHRALLRVRRTVPAARRALRGREFHPGCACGAARSALPGDGTPHRSYLYAADLAIWLWTILLRGQPMRPYNVGSEAGLTIEELARPLRARVTPGAAVDVAQGRRLAGAPAQCYVPAVTAPKRELGLRLTVPLAEAIRRTADWHRTVARDARVGFR